ncbi:MAG: sugar nucleotide-binding protein [Gemmatimonadales bacterium]
MDGLAERPDVLHRRILPISTTEWPAPAKRPVYSVLDTSTWPAAFRMVPRSWREALDEVLCELT